MSKIDSKRFNNVTLECNKAFSEAVIVLWTVACAGIWNKSRFDKRLTRLYGAISALNELLSCFSKREYFTPGCTGRILRRWVIVKIEAVILYEMLLKTRNMLIKKNMVI